MVKHKSLIAKPGKMQKIAGIKLTTSEKNEIEKLVSELAKAILQELDQKKKTKEIKKQENLYVRRRVGRIHYSSHGVNIGHALRRITKKDWSSIIPQCKQSARNLKEFINLKKKLKPRLKEQTDFYLAVLGDFLVDEYFKNKLDSKNILKTKKLFIKDLEFKKSKTFANVEIFGIELKKSKIKLAKQIELDRVTTKDLDFEIPMTFDDHDRPFPSAFLRLETKNYEALNKAINNTIISLRLFKIGSAREGMKTTSSESVVFRGEGHSYPGNFGASSDISVLSKSDCDKFKEFWKLLGKFIIGKRYYMFNEKFSYLNIAYERFSDSLLNGDHDFRISSAVMALEAVFLNENMEISYKLKNRIARLLSFFNFDTEKILKDISLAYSIRSAYVHGSKLSKDDKKKLDEIHDQDFISKEIILKRIQEYFRISFLHLLILNKNKENFIKNLNMGQIDNKWTKKLEKQTKKTYSVIRLTPKFTPYESPF